MLSDSSSSSSKSIGPSDRPRRDQQPAAIDAGVHLLLQLRWRLLQMHAEKHARQQQQDTAAASSSSSSSGSRSILTDEQAKKVMHTAMELHSLLANNGDEQVALLSGSTFPTDLLLESGAALHQLQLQQSDDVQVAAQYALQYMRDVLQPDAYKALEEQLSGPTVQQVRESCTLLCM
jgi:hypothetical protein